MRKLAGKAIVDVDGPFAAVAENAFAHRGTWETQDDLFWLARLMEEVGELASSLTDHHEHQPSHELVQIGGICINWLRRHSALGSREWNEYPDQGGEKIT